MSVPALTGMLIQYRYKSWLLIKRDDIPCHILFNKYTIRYLSFFQNLRLL